jgi:hypothetical protein
MGKTCLYSDRKDTLDTTQTVGSWAPSPGCEDRQCYHTTPEEDMQEITTTENGKYDFLGSHLTRRSTAIGSGSVHAFLSL